MVSKAQKTLQRILDNQKNIRFQDMVRVVEAFGFELERTQGSHHIFSRPEIPELINLQEVGGQAKPYQIRQFLRLVESYNLEIGEGQ